MTIGSRFAGFAQEVLAGEHQVLGVDWLGDVFAICESHDGLEEHMSPFRIVESNDCAFLPGHDVLSVFGIICRGDLLCHFLEHCGVIPTFEFVLEDRGRSITRWLFEGFET